MPIAPVGQGLLRSTAAELTQLQQQLAEVDPNDPQAIMQLQQQIAQLQTKTDAQQAISQMQALQQQVDTLARMPGPMGPAGQDAQLAAGGAQTLDPGSAATVEIEDGLLWLGIPRGQDGSPGAPGKDGQSITGPQGPVGPAGKDATIQAGTVTTAAPGQPAAASIDNGVLNLVIPQGQTGATGAAGKDGQSVTGPAGPVGPVGPSGKDGAAGKDGQIGATGPVGATGAQGPIGATGPTGPKGDTGQAGATGSTGATGAVGPQGPAGANALSSIAAPTAISPLPAFGTAYQVTKTSNLSICVDVSYTASLVALEDVIELRVGSDATVATTGGVVVASWRAGLTGLAGIVGMVISSRDQLTAIVPGSMYWALRRTKGTASTVVSAVIQPLV